MLDWFLISSPSFSLNSDVKYSFVGINTAVLYSWIYFFLILSVPSYTKQHNITKEMPATFPSASASSRNYVL